ncbi:MAG: tRNA glutamyl-Q(34) synthetase GluQRS [Rhodospirillales bacterium]
MSVVTRFAPSPTGDLHLGHAYAAWFAHDLATRSGGRFLVRIEDIDVGRCRDEFVARNLDDLRWLGLTWEQPVVRQSERMDRYGDALCRLSALDVVYPCFCTRGEIRAEIEAAAAAPHAAAADGGPVYPGRCRGLAANERADRLAAGRPYALRLDAERARRLTGALSWTDGGRGPQSVRPDRFGDVVVARKEIATSYHLAVVVDDAAQGVTHVTRGEDLFEATHVQRTLYALLDLPVPVWHHHGLCRDRHGRRLAKRDGAASIRSLRERGHPPEQVLAMAKAAGGGP